MIGLQYLVHAVKTSVLELCFVKSVWQILNSINIIPLVGLSKFEHQFLWTKKQLLISKKRPAFSPAILIIMTAEKNGMFAVLQIRQNKESLYIF